jgi:hypothetical protein
MAVKLHKLAPGRKIPSGSRMVDQPTCLKRCANNPLSMSIITGAFSKSYIFTFIADIRESEAIEIGSGLLSSWLRKNV